MTRGEDMHTRKIPGEGRRNASHSRKNYTLFELVEAVDDELAVDDDRLVAIIVDHMIDEGKVRFSKDCHDGLIS